MKSVSVEPELLTFRRSFLLRELAGVVMIFTVTPLIDIALVELVRLDYYVRGTR